MYAARGFTGIRIIKFKTSGPGWNNNIQRLWEVRSLIRQLKLHKDDRPYFDNEFLIECSIPEESITNYLNWEEDKKTLDPDGTFEREALNDLDFKRETAKLKKERREEKKKMAEEAAAEERKADGLGESESEPEPQMKKRKVGKLVKVGIKMGRDVGV
ncbi:uncharacterized protein ColSpa_11403 [Colletotrichum spaethianum]|uniref:Uncharacterized protein n=1 Tax=Colletotrichum spaethianum TaxID=700344 RepID=A0AA37PFI5_9PEZI|nr:uncharacterized protein ColSpa_11403 [Colletotrichum spaethianum]GKT51222.1 hypothetical protein ColSpa_11403 [Colletotrichum spaethianum]